MYPSMLSGDLIAAFTRSPPMLQSLDHPHDDMQVVPTIRVRSGYAA
jgi:hypothetical protein